MDKKLKQRVKAVTNNADGAYTALVNALRSASRKVLEELLEHSTPDVRRAVAEACQGREEERGIAKVVLRLVADKAPTVRTLAAHSLPALPVSKLPADRLRWLLLEDYHTEVRTQAAHACRNRTVLADALTRALQLDGAWEVRAAAARALPSLLGASALPHLLTALADDNDDDVWRACIRQADRLLERGVPEDMDVPPVSTLRKAHVHTQRANARPHPALARWLQRELETRVDVDALRAFGADLTRAAQEGELPRAHFVDAAVDLLQKLLEGPPPHSAVLLGAPGTGKSAIVHELVHRLGPEPAGRRVVRIQPSEILAGTLFLGEWETKVRDLLELVRSPRRVLIVMPNLGDLAFAGSHSRSDRNIADMLAPHIESGDVALIGEATPEDWTKSVARNPAMSGLFTPIEVAAAGDDLTRDLVERICEVGGVDADPRTLDRLMELADSYRPGRAQPGRAVGLLRRVLQRVGEEMTVRDVLLTLHEATGIPVDLLDDDVPLDLDEVRDFFEQRVMGQPEAVGAVVDLVTLIKAGLTDPGKPFGVLFFVGPTGVGKTELARALAEMLFSDPARLLRYDMSEYATYDGFERLIGRPGTPGTLTDAVRRHPFSVVLLDEIEKSHVNVFDLCLQVFDAGRLTDGAGATADFRNTIVILTSNVGSQVRTDPSVGFGADAPETPDRDTILRELGRAFRPEFLNRLDHVVQFAPLTLETAERIARREVARAVDRSGVERRRLTLDVDASVLARLLREGYSLAFGARPLKRTVEKHVLLPIARTVATGEVSAGSVLRLVDRGGRVVVETTPPDDHEDAAAEEVSPDLEHLRRRVEELREIAAPVEERKAELLTASHETGFWNDAHSARGVLDEIHRLDRLLGEVARLGREVERTAGNRDAERAARFRAWHEREAGRLAFLLRCGDLADTYLTLTALKAQRGGLDGVARLARMYLGLAARRGLEAEVLDDRRGGRSTEDTITLLVAGSGAHALLAGEAGLHQLTQHAKGRRMPDRRELVRVDVLRAPDDDRPLPPEELGVQTRGLRGIEGRVVPQPDLELHLFHEPSRIAVQAWTDKERDEALALLHPLLRARVERRDEAGSAPIVRRYRLGASPLVRDRRTGRTSGRLDDVLRGGLEPFLGPG